MSERRARAAIPTAAALSCAVKDGDRDEVARILLPMTVPQLHALAVVLAAHVDIEEPLRPEHTPGDVYALATRYAAEYFEVSAEAIRSRDRTRRVAHARIVAMAVARKAGRTTVEIGRAFDRDHTSVIHACERANHDPMLKLAVERVALRVGVGAAVDAA